MYTRLQTVWSLPSHSRQANKDHSPRCHRRPNGPGRRTVRSSNLPHSLQRGVPLLHVATRLSNRSPSLRPRRDTGTAGGGDHDDDLIFEDFARLRLKAGETEA